MSDNNNWVDPNAVNPEGNENHDTKLTKEQLEAKAEEARVHAENIGEAAMKFAQEAGYAAAGFAGLVGEKAKSFYEEQKKNYAETHPDVDKDPGAKEFLEQLSDKLNKFVEDLTRGFKDLAERGRGSVDPKRGEDTVASNESAGTAGAAAGFADPWAAPDADDLDLHEEPASDDVEVGVVDEERHDL